VFDGNYERHTGEMLNLRVTEARGFTLYCELPLR
jgi:hypothetical protein